jgi:DNA-binding NtrC family response regulator
MPSKLITEQNMPHSWTILRKLPMEEMMVPTQISSFRQNETSRTSIDVNHEAICHQKTLLLAEDDETLRLIMECSLSAMGYLVVACADASRASAAFRANAIDVLLTDFEMPGKTGLELARELTAIQPSLPVMVITGSMLSSEILQELQDRQWVYMSKPSNLSVVESILEKLIHVHDSLAA